MSKSKPIFSLDIGTRKVAGVVVEATDEGYRVVAARLLEHPDRAMLDGQVHKVDAVAAVVSKIKEMLEADLGYTLEAASVAAAGRALLTHSYEKSRTYSNPTEINKEDVLALKLAAVKGAQQELQSKEKNYQLHCVGYSAVTVALDGEPLDDLVGHQGKRISTKVIATFLPRQVVDSLMAVLRRSQLVAESLTLEPIAAIEATIPTDLRRMNLALVDIGAGTSDIALTRNGSVFAYDMVTMAGDEITEALCDEYLLEFKEAERLKRQLNEEKNDNLTFTTLLGQKNEVARQQIMRIIEPVVKVLAGKIAEAIQVLNEELPKAVILVGGGSETPELGETLANALGMDASRVGKRGPETIGSMTCPEKVVSGIEWVTPLGIALSAHRDHGLKFKTIQVNNQSIQMLALNQNSSVFDALLSAGCELKQLHPRPGAAITYTLAGNMMSVPGSQGQAARLLLDGQEVGLDTVIEEGMELVLEEAIAGEDAQLLPEMIPVPQGPFWCIINGERCELDLILMDRNKPVNFEKPLQDRAQLNWMSGKTLLELSESLKQQLEQHDKFSFKVNGKKRQVKEQQVVITINNQPGESDYRPKPGDRIQWSVDHQSKIALQELVQELPQSKTISVTVNGKERRIDAGGSRIMINGHPASKEDYVAPDDNVAIESLETQPPILSQVLDGLDIHPPKHAASIKLRVNGKEAGFTTPLEDGAQIEVSFG